MREGLFLRNLYNLALHWGLKVHASSLISNPTPPQPILYWENAPPWARELGLADARPDDVQRKGAVLEALFKLSHEQQESGDGFGNFIMGIIRDPLHLYFAVERARREHRLSGKIEPAIKLIEEEYMNKEQKASMVELAKIGIEIAPSPKWSANDHRWVMQEALRALEQARAQKLEEPEGFVSAQLAAYASRFTKMVSINKIDPLCARFSMLLVNYLNTYYDGVIPSGITRSYLINHYAYEYRNNYRAVRPKEEQS